MEINVATALQNRLRGSGCRAHGSNQMVKNVEWDEAFFPDAMVVCGGMEEVPHGTLKAATNPVVVVEVLSPTTGGHDRDHKLYAYQAMPSERETILIQTGKPVVEHYIRIEDGGRFEATFGLDVPMAEIYEDAEPPEEPEE